MRRLSAVDHLGHTKPLIEGGLATFVAGARPNSIATVLLHFTTFSNLL
jgi:hypothetical protein